MAVNLERAGSIAGVPVRRLAVPSSSSPECCQVPGSVLEAEDGAMKPSMIILERQAGPGQWCSCGQRREAVRVSLLTVASFPLQMDGPQDRKAPMPHSQSRSCTELHKHLTSAPSCPRAKALSPDRGLQPPPSLSPRLPTKEDEEAGEDCPSPQLAPATPRASPVE